MSTSVVTVVGARPQFIKASAVSRAMAKAGIREVLVHTGQHHDSGMSDVFFEDLNMAPPSYNLGVHGGGHGAMTGRMLEGIETILVKQAPDWVLVYGDTNSTLAGALAAAKLHIRIAHVEAGLRSYNRRMPEEINRVLTDHVSQLLLCPTRTAVGNLELEGIVQGVHHVGDVMYDTALAAAKTAAERSTVMEREGLSGVEFALATVHRAENTDDPRMLTQVIDYLKAHAGERQVVLPLHPRTCKAVAAIGLDLDGLTLLPPQGYLDMVRLISRCDIVLTDSGGLQKEAYFHRKPCVTLRTETEWLETIEYGWNRLWTADGFRLPRRDIPDYGLGNAAERIVSLLATP